MRKLKKKIILILILIYILIFGVSTSYSMYVDKTEAKTENLEFAKIIFNNEELDELSLPINNLIPGNSLDYKFKISNNKNGIRSEINIGYYITVETYHIIPTTIRLYSTDEEEKLVLDCNESNYTRNHENKLVCKTPNFNLNYQTDSINSYKIKITFNDLNNEGKTWSEDYSDLIDFIDIKINSWQVVE